MVNSDWIKKEKKYLSQLSTKSKLYDNTQTYSHNDYEKKSISSEVDISKYNEEFVLTITDISECLYYDNSKFVQEGNAITSKGSVSNYISILEKNLGFSSPSKEYAIDVDSDYLYHIEYQGDEGVNTDTLLFVIFYNDREKVEVNTLRIGQSSSFRPTNVAKTMRLALKMEGRGRFNFGKIVIKRRKNIEELSYMDYKKLGVEDEKEIADLVVACIFDEFTTECYKHECELLPITPYNWEAIFTLNNPDIFVCESAWEGNDGEWSRKVAYRDEDNIKILKNIIKYCKKRNIPTVFWNKEDPTHFDVFINTAKIFDYIFTTESNCISKYKNAVKKDNVYVLPFAAQHKIHNPIKTINRKHCACFAGSYYAHKYPERRRDIERLLDASKETIGIEIYDRKHGLNDKNFIFPERFRPFIVGKLNPFELEIANKGYDVMINVNSEKDSPTMFSRRVFEGLACGTPVVSAYSNGIKNIFGDLVVSSDNEEELKSEFNKLATDEAYYKEKRDNAIRQIMSEHTYSHRLKTICDIAGVKVKDFNDKLTIISKLSDISNLKNIIHEFDNQSYKNKELIILIKGDAPSLVNKLMDREDIRCIYDNYYEKERVHCEKVIKNNVVGYLDGNRKYPKDYFKDLMYAMRYSYSNIISYAQDDMSEYTYVPDAKIKQSVVNIDQLNTVDFYELIQMFNKNISCKKLFKSGNRIFAISKGGNYEKY